MTSPTSPHKEAFLTPGNISAKARHYVDRFPPHGRIAFDPGRAALLVIDMQRYFVDGRGHSFVPSAPAIVPGIARLAEAFERAGRPVVRTRHVNTPGDAGLMGDWWGEVLSPDDPGSVIVPELTGREELVKCRYDAFHGTGLEAMLRARGAAQVVVTGVLTHLCCETTARAAFTRDLAVFFAVDGTATYNEELHIGSLRALAHGFATPVVVDDVIGRMKA
ncbi:MAG: isochorismatase family protein [Thermoplasmata archaeon]|nr:isochorismatase family protein [Thermoplasmata archaeon]